MNLASVWSTKLADMFAKDTTLATIANKDYNMGSDTNFNIRRIDNGFLVEGGNVHYCKDMDEVRVYVTSLIEKAFK